MDQELRDLHREVHALEDRVRLLENRERFDVIIGKLDRILAALPNEAALAKLAADVNADTANELAKTRSLKAALEAASKPPTTIKD